ncbi:hypothetical protein OJM16_gp82 [uncultured phage cr35_1]|uniref:Uncharacterized protein n=1 Tax=uncultured phage cr35_1 TaxID=2986408 RepID=A0AAE7S2X5_9CAUD|nr:hypothetical protein OJM16_gp82 [uncultured phage cr35_1]QWM91342.1 hypothetical protein [uncultured phage cr35_1]
MITRVDTVLIGKTCPAPYTKVDSLTPGAVALFDENKSLIKDEASAVKASTVYVGVAGDNMTITLPDGTTATKRMIEYSNAIQKASKPSYVIGNYVAPVQEKIEIDLTSATVVIGHRYVLRIVYKDMYEAPGQFTHTYEAIATTKTAGDLGNALLKKINKHANRRVNATFTNNKLTLTALPKDDNEGVYSLNEYSVVSMEASLYVTIPGALLSNVPEKVPGAIITKTAGKPGKGYWKQVRDMEVRMLGYKGHVFTDAYPIIEPKRNVTEGASYDYIIIENDNLYLSPDNQYIKTTPLTTELYIEKSDNLSTSQFVKNLKAFITGVDSAA